MPRRRVPEKREILPDPKYANQTLAKFMNHVMVSGKKSVAEKIVYGALDRIKERTGGDPLETFEAALEASRPQWKLSHDELAVLLIRCLLKCGLQEEVHLQCDGLSILRESAVRNQWLSD